MFLKLVSGTIIAGAMLSFGPIAPSADAQAQCREQCKNDCALFVPRGSAQWASCANWCISFSCTGSGVTAEQDDIIEDALRLSGHIKAENASYVEDTQVESETTDEDLLSPKEAEDENAPKKAA